MDAQVARTPRGAGGGWSPLRRFQNLRLVVKLPLIISALTLIVAGVLTYSAYHDSRKILEDQIRTQFRGLVEERLRLTKAYLTDIESDIATQAENPTVRAALASFNLSWSAIDGDASQVLQKSYIQDNPHPVGAKDELIDTGTRSQYDIVHSKYHPYMRAVQRARGYYDIFLVDTDGDVVYSVFKESDFATNLKTGPWRDTDLAAAWREAMQLPEGESAFYDFRRYAPSQGAAASFMATPIFGAAGLMGTLVVQMPADRLSALVADVVGLGETGQVYIVGTDNRLRSETRFQDGPGVLEEIPPQAVFEDARRNGISGFERTTGLSGGAVRAMAAGFAFDENDYWTVMVEQAEAEIMAPIGELRNLLLTQAAALSAVIAIIGMLFARATAKPIAGIGDALGRMSGGDYGTDIPYRDRGDDAGELARNLDHLRGQLSSAERARAEQARQAADQHRVVEQLSEGIGKLAGGDLTAKIAEPFATEYESLRNAFNGALDRMNETMTALLSATRQIDSNSRDVENASNELSQKAIEQAASLEQTAAAITELSASVKSTADAAGEADKIMSRAKSDAEASGQEVNRAMTAMDQIATSSQKITQVTSVIEDLAFQTNLLALNAGVEAARAGEAGRGFAVVASEVRALAQRSSDAAKEINGLIQESADNVTNGVDLVEKAGKSFENLILDFEKVSASVSSIATAAREQSVGLSEINTAVDQLDGVTQKNAAVATEVHGTGKIMVSEAAKLNRIAAHFRIDPNAPASPASVPASRPVAPPQALAVNAGPLMGARDMSDEVWAEF